MTTRLGFLHAHHSNIGYIDQELRPFAVQAVHFVDPGLVHRVTTDPALSEAAARERVRDQIAWICACDVAAVVVTCTNYAALLGGEPTPVPVVTIDEPFCAEICAEKQPQVLLFTNPATVEGTMQRLRAYAATVGASPIVEARLVPDAFPLVMQGKTVEYDARVETALREAISRSAGGPVSVAQLSMVSAARQVGAELGFAVGQPLTALARHLQRSLSLRSPTA